MSLFNNKRKDYSIRPPRQQVNTTPFFVTDSANIDFTLSNLNLTADLTFTGVVAGTYGDATNIPVLQIDQWGRVTGVTLQPISPSGLVLETNGTANTSQTILNLTSGTDIQVVDLGGGVIQFNYTGTGGTYTVNNGLSAESGNPNNFQLGSTTSGGAPLLHDTYIDTTVNHTLYLEGQKTSTNDFILDVDNSTADGGAIRASAVGNGNAIRALSSLASALAANSTGAPAIAATTGGANEAGLFVNSDTGTNNIVQGIKLRHSSSGVPAPGFGIAADFTGKTTLNSDLRLGRLIYQWTDPITISRTSKFQLETVNLNAAGIKLEVDGPGQLILNQYTTGTSFASVSGTSVGVLNVDSAGKVFVGAGGGGNSIGELTSDVTAGPASSPSQSVAATLKTNLKTGTFGVTVDGVTGVVQVGNVGYVVMPYAGQITGWSITSNVVGTISFDITSASGAIPTVSIIGVGGNYPTLTSNQFITSTTTTNWILTFAAGDVFGFSVRSSPAPSLIKNATLTIRTTKT